MNWRDRDGIAFVTVAALAFTAAAGLANEKPGPSIKVETGTLAGSVAGGVESWKGIPFAAPPVGPLRWRAPQPAAHWKGVRPATAYRNDCMQKPFPSDAAPLGTPPAEDCLYMNVWRPAGKASKLPVIFWIYGGGFVNGGSSPADYSGANSPARASSSSASTIAFGPSAHSPIPSSRNRMPTAESLATTATWISSRPSNG